MKALVTGGTGFIGSHLVERLLERGVEVACTVEPNTPLSWLEDLPVEIHYCDLASDERLADILRGVDVVYHLAGVMRVRTREEFERGNVQATRNLLDAVETSGPKLSRFLYVSSQGAAGPCAGPEAKTEDDLCNPITQYGITKLAAEEEVRSRADRFPCTIVRPSSVYGPRDGNFLRLFRTIRRHVKPLLRGGRSQVSLVYVDDLVRGILLAAESETAVGQTYFITGESLTARAITEAFAEAVGTWTIPFRHPYWLVWLIGEFNELIWKITGQPQVIARRKVREMRERFWLCSFEKAERDFGYEPQVLIQEGARRTFDWYRQQGWL